MLIVTNGVSACIYRFVKERRPSISPNFNFLGQLQLFQGTLTTKCTNAHYLADLSGRPLDLPQPFPTIDHTDCSSTVLLSTKLIPSAQDLKKGNKEHAEDTKVSPCCDASNHTLIQDSRSDDTKAQSENKAFSASKSPEFTLSLSDRLKSLTLSLQPIELQAPLEAHRIPQKPTTLQIPSDPVLILEKRKRLTLALTPVSASLQTPQRDITQSSKTANSRACATNSSKLLHKGESEAQHRNRRSQSRPKVEEEKVRQRKVSSTRHPNAHRSPSRSVTRRKDGQNQDLAVTAQDAEAKDRMIKLHQGATEYSCKTKTVRIKEIPATNVSGSLQKVSPSTALEAVEGLSGDSDLMSPLSLTVNKLLDWGEKMLLGVLLGPRIKVGQPALPYRC